MERSKRITVYGLAIYLLLFVSQLHAAGLAEWYEAAGDSFFEKMNSVKSEKENFAAMKMGMDGAITAPSVPSTPAPAFVSPYNKAQLDDFSNNMPLDEDEVKIYQKGKTKGIPHYEILSVIMARKGIAPALESFKNPYSQSQMTDFTENGTLNDSDKKAWEKARSMGVQEEEIMAGIMAHKGIAVAPEEPKRSFSEVRPLPSLYSQEQIDSFQNSVKPEKDDFAAMKKGRELGWSENEIMTTIMMKHGIPEKSAAPEEPKRSFPEDISNSTKETVGAILLIFAVGAILFYTFRKIPSMKIGTFLVLIIILALIFNGISTGFPGTNTLVDTRGTGGTIAGFWTGLWHGFIITWSFIVSIFFDRGIYEVHNNGGWYNFGFLFGVGLGAGGFGSFVKIVGEITNQRY